MTQIVYLPSGGEIGETRVCELEQTTSKSGVKSERRSGAEAEENIPIVREERTGARHERDPAKKTKAQITWAAGASPAQHHMAD